MGGLALVIHGVMIVGCGSGTPEVPPVPGIVDARDVRDADPCALPPTDRLTTLGLQTDGAAGQAPEGPSCRWRGDEGEGLTVTLYTDGGGLATLAENSEPTTRRVRVAGYPALETFTGQGEFCQYDVGVAEGQVVIAALEAPSPDSCTALQSVLTGLVENLPAAQR